jgi:co-chaperonin GroES (HSP10)
MVLANESNPYRSTIVAQVEDNDTDGDGYVMAMNVFDNTDEVAINKMALRKGDVVLITFYHDDVVKVKLNQLNIGDKVKGQKIIK